MHNTPNVQFIRCEIKHRFIRRNMPQGFRRTARSLKPTRQGLRTRSERAPVCRFYEV